MKWLTNLFGDSNDKLIEKMRITVDEINSKEQSFSNLSEGFFFTAGGISFLFLFSGLISTLV